MKHPNATVSLVSGSGVGSIVAWLLDDVGHLGISPVACVAIGGAISALALFIGKEGLQGTWNLILHGSKGGK